MTYKVFNETEANVRYAPFNSKLDSETQKPDRAIDATDFRRWLSSTNSDGVARQFDRFNLTFAGGMNVVLGRGIGLVQGASMVLDTPLTIALENSSAAGDRIDVIGFRLSDKDDDRNVLPYYQTGEVGSGAAPESAEGEIPLWRVTVRKNATSINPDTDFADVRDYVVSSATYFIREKQYYSTTSDTRSVIITQPFNAETDDVEILVNGVSLLDTQYKIEGNLITFNGTIPSGNEIQVNILHFMEGRGTIDNLDKVAVLQDTINSLHQYFYTCSGDDNRKLSKLAQDFLYAEGDFKGTPEYANMEVVVCGTPIISAKYGNGTSTDPYVYFKFEKTGSDGEVLSTTRTIRFNFGNCRRIVIDATVSNSAFSVIFKGPNLDIRNLALDVNSGYKVYAFAGEKTNVEDSEVWMKTTGECLVNYGGGFFKNVRTSITSTNGNAICFYNRGGLLRVIGGTHYALATSENTTGVACCFYVINASSNDSNVMMLSMVNCPSKGGYRQDDTVNVYRGYCTVMMSTLWKAATFADPATESNPNGKQKAYGNVILSKDY